MFRRGGGPFYLHSFGVYRFTGLFGTKILYNTMDSLTQWIKRPQSIDGKGEKR
jgi:hypothetical protein